MKTPSPRGRSRRTGGGPDLPAPYWSLGASDLLARLESSAQGLSDPEAQRRLERYGPNLLAARRRFSALGVLLAQFRNPLVLILVFAAAVSLVVREWHDAGIVLLIVLGSALLGFAQEYQAGRAVERLLARVKLNARVLRGGELRPLPVEALVPGEWCCSRPAAWCRRTGCCSRPRTAS